MAAGLIILLAGLPDVEVDILPTELSALQPNSY
jgi:hypothetical protein